MAWKMQKVLKEAGIGVPRGFLNRWILDFWGGALRGGGWVWKLSYELFVSWYLNAGLFLWVHPARGGGRSMTMSLRPAVS